MRKTDEKRFLYALASMEMHFRDTLNSDYRDLYFQIATHKGWTIEDWESACMLALGDETFNAVPIAGVMQRYIDDVRREQRKQFELDQKLLYQDQKQIETAERQQEAQKTYDASLAKLAALWGEDWLAGHKRMLDSLYPDTQKEQD
jgi:hypothetical protein